MYSIVLSCGNQFDLQTDWKHARNAQSRSTLAPETNCKVAWVPLGLGLEDVRLLLGRPGLWRGGRANAFLLPHFLLKEFCTPYSWRSTPSKQGLLCLFNSKQRSIWVPGFIFPINFSSCHASLQTSAEMPVRVQGQIHAACVVGVQQEPKNNQGATCANTSGLSVSWPFNLHSGKLT